MQEQNRELKRDEQNAAEINFTNKLKNEKVLTNNELKSKMNLENQNNELRTPNCKMEPKTVNMHRNKRVVQCKKTPRQKEQCKWIRIQHTR